MPECVAQGFQDFAIADPFPGLAGKRLAGAHDAPFTRHVGANVGPSARMPVANIVDVSRPPGSQGEEAEPGQIFDMDQIYEFIRGADTSLPDPLHRIATWAVNAGHAEDYATMLCPEIFFPLDAGKVQIDGACLVNPGGEICHGLIALIVG